MPSRDNDITIRIFDPQYYDSNYYLRHQNDTETKTDPETEQKLKELYCDLLQGVFCALFCSSFATNTESPKNYGGKQCVVLLAWGKATVIYLFAGFIILGIVNPVLTLTMPTLGKCNPTAPQWIFNNLSYYIRLIMYIWGGIIVLGLLFSLKHNENCGDLASGTQFFIWVVVAIAILIGFCYYCGCYVLKQDEATTDQTVEQQNPISEEKPEDYGTMQNQLGNQEQEQEDQKSIIEAENQQQEEKQEQQQLQQQQLQQQQLQQQQEIDDPDKRVEKPKEEIQELQ